MSFRKHPLGLLVQLNPESATSKLLATFRRYHGNTMKTARSYGVSTSTLKRWVATLEGLGYTLRDAIEEMRDQVQP